MSKRIIYRMSIVLSCITAAMFFLHYDLGRYLTLDNLKQNHEFLTGQFTQYPARTTLIFSALYIFATAFSVPGATVLTLAGGAIFGFWYGTLLVSFTSTIGATLSFLGARFLFGNSFQHRFKERLTKINKGIQRDGAFYLFTLRLLPIFPFFLINILMGLTSIRIPIYMIVSQIGMLPGTAVYVNFGTQISKLESLRGLLSPEIVTALILLGLLPLLSRWIVGSLRARKNISKYKKPSSFDYNLIVIGGGSAGLISAYIASAVNAKVALIEKQKMGGDCLNTGCVPSKALLRSAKILKLFKRAEDFGLEKPEINFNFSKVMDRVQDIIRKIAPHDSTERYAQLGVDCILGKALIKSPYEVEVNGKILRTKNIAIATGASPFVPPLAGLDKISHYTSESIWSLRALPKKLIILGGGPIGCELAQCFQSFGSEIVLIEMSDRLLMREDLDVSSLVLEKFKVEGINVRLGQKAVRIEIVNSVKILVCESQGEELCFAFDEILFALGRRANIKGLGLEELGLEISESGTLVADKYLRTTNYPNIYVCGDVTGPYQFTHTASYQAWFVAVNSLFSPFKKFKVDYRVVPWCTFIDPEVARVGINENEATEKGIQFEVTKYELKELDRAITESETCGFIKVLTAPGSDKILGATIVGDHAGEIICEYVAAMKHGFGLNKILGTIHIYPTFSEANKSVAGLWKRNNAPKPALKFLTQYHKWRRS